eukprot:9249021-Alexandrium_andersonii.AAC.1
MGLLEVDPGYTSIKAGLNSRTSVESPPSGSRARAPPGAGRPSAPASAGGAGVCSSYRCGN